MIQFMYLFHSECEGVDDSTLGGCVGRMMICNSSCVLGCSCSDCCIKY